MNKIQRGTASTLLALATTIASAHAQESASPISIRSTAVEVAEAEVGKGGEAPYFTRWSYSELTNTVNLAYYGGPTLPGSIYRLEWAKEGLNSDDPTFELLAETRGHFLDVKLHEPGNYVFRVKQCLRDDCTPYGERQPEIRVPARPELDGDAPAWTSDSVPRWVHGDLEVAAGPVRLEWVAQPQPDESELWYSLTIGHETHTTSESYFTFAPPQAGVYHAHVRQCAASGCGPTSPIVSISVGALGTVSKGGIPRFVDEYSFIHSGQNPSQVGLDTALLEEGRVAVVRGRVLDQSLTPLAGVEVSVKGRPGLGHSETDSEGYFNLMVNGGAQITLEYAASQRPRVQRKLQPVANQIQLAPDVVMVQLDTQSTVVLSNLGALQVAEASTASDADGPRTVRMLFQPHTQAAIHLSDGGTTPLEKWTVRATEYTVGANGRLAMPGPLPSTSAYNYAVELSIDEAQAYQDARVEFSNPVAVYVENFTRMPVGGAVPAGYYDYTLEAWLAADNGRIIEILPSGGAKLAQIDADGDGVPDTAESLAPLGITPEELEALPLLYPNGGTFWRVNISHFTPWDFNWPFSLPPGAEPPSLDDLSDWLRWLNNCLSGSIVECQNQVLRTALPISGADATLSYRSDLQLGHRKRREIKVPLWNGAAPPPLKRIVLKFDIAGRRYVVPLDRATLDTSGGEYTFRGWDGFDAFGRVPGGAVLATVSMDYVYDMFAYSVPADFEQAFARVPNPDWVSPIQIDSERLEITLTQSRQYAVGGWDAKSQGLGGMLLSPVHQLDVVAKKVHRGDGSTQQLTSGGEIVSTQVGQFGPLPQQDVIDIDEVGRNPIDPLRVSRLKAVALAEFEGRHYVANYDRVFSLDADQTFRRIAGGGSATPGTKPGDPLTFRLGEVAALSKFPGRGILIATRNPGRVYLLDRDGTLSLFAGSGFGPYTYSPGDDGNDARSVGIGWPTAIAASGDGYVYVAHTVELPGRPFACYFSVLRRIDPDHRIYSVMGRDVPSCATLDSPFTSLNNLQISQAHVNALAVDSRGNVLLGIGQSGWNFPKPNSVLRITPSGQVEHLAGSGVSPSGSDITLPTRTGALALNTPFKPTGLAPDSLGGFYLLEGSIGTNNGRFTALSYVSGEGIVTHRAGSFNCPRDEVVEEGVLVANAPACNLTGMSLDEDGSILVADAGLHRVRKLTTNGLFSRRSRYVVPAPDGATVDVFDLAGRHVESKNAYTGATLMSVGYEDGAPSVVQDAYGNQIRVIRGGDSADILSPDGQRTQVVGGVSPNGPGYAEAVIGQLSGHVRLDLSNLGLLEGLKAPSMEQSPSWTKTYQYEFDGRLKGFGDVEGAWTVLRRDEHRYGYDAATETAQGRTQSQSVDFRRGGRTTEVSLDTNGLVTRAEDCGDGRSFRRLPDGVSLMVAHQPDTRFGQGAPNADLEYWIDGQITEGACETRYFENDGYWSGALDPLPPAKALTLVQRRSVSGDSGQLDLRADQIVETASFVPRLVTTSGEPIDCEASARSGRNACRSYRSTFDRETMTFTYESPMGRTIREHVAPSGAVIRLQIPGVLPITYGYDDRGRLEVVRQGDRVAVTEYHPSSSALTKSASDAGGSIRQAGYAVRPNEALIRTYFDLENGGRSQAIVQADQERISLEYDANRSLSSVRLPGSGGAFHSYGSDVLGRPSVYNPPGLDFRRTLYSADGDLEAVLIAPESGESRRVSYIYAPGSDRLEHVDFSEGRISYAYAPISGAPSTASAPGNVELNWDYLGPLLKEERVSTPNYELTQEHDYDNNLWLNWSRVGGEQIDYEFDLDGLLVQAGAMQLGRRADNGWVQRRDLGVVGEEVEAFTPYGQIERSRVTAGAGFSVETSFEYDLLGRITRRTEAVVSGGAGLTTTSEQYVYDVIGQLTEVRSGSGALLHRYTYDERGNRTGGSTVPASEYTADDRLSSRAGETYSYRVSGELKSSTVGGVTTEYNYDEFSNLRSVVLASGVELSYLIDAQNRRVGLRRNGVFEKGWVYRDLLNPSAQIGAGGSVEQVYVYGDVPHVPAYIIDKVGNRTLRVISDERGSVRWVVDVANGSVVQALRYGPWGEVLYDSNPGFQPFGYAGGLYDHETGLVRFGARDYAPWLGRWTTKDPIGQAGGFNVYAYAANDPINFIDPSGTSPAMCELIRELAAQIPGMQLSMALMDPNATAWDIAMAVASEMPWNRALRAARAVSKVLGAAKGAAAGREATGFLGRAGHELKNAPYQKVRNEATQINGRDFSGHALDQMQNRGVMPSVVENVLNTGTQFPTRAGTTGFYDAANNVRVIVNSETGRVVTVIRGAP